MILGAVTAKTFSWQDWHSVSPLWEQLLCSFPNASFFLTGEWVSTWLEVFGRVLDPEIVFFYDREKPIGCALLVRKTERIRKLPIRRVYLNCSGEDEQDETCIEHNGLIAVPEQAASVRQVLRQCLSNRAWDEFIACGCSGQPEEMQFGLPSQRTQAQPDYFVDLQKVRDSGKAYDTFLSSNTRTQIRRAVKLYEASGPLQVREPSTLKEALQGLDDLAGLHQSAWTAKGKPGVFSSSLFMEFHRKLITRTFGRNVLLLRICNSTTIGMLYSFFYRGRVYFYQSGFQFTDDKKLKPGLVSHYLAIQHCLQKPEIMEYDFLAGDSQYKRSLASDNRNMYWITCTNRTARNAALRGLRKAMALYKRGSERKESSGKSTESGTGSDA